MIIFCYQPKQRRIQRRWKCTEIFSSEHVLFLKFLFPGVLHVCGSVRYCFLRIRAVDSCNPISCLVVLCVLFLNGGSLFSPFLSCFVLCCSVQRRNEIWAIVNKTTSRKDSYCIAMTELILRGSLHRSISKVVTKRKQRAWPNEGFLKRYTSKT